MLNVFHNLYKIAKERQERSADSHRLAMEEQAKKRKAECTFMPDFSKTQKYTKKYLARRSFFNLKPSVDKSDDFKTTNKKDKAKSRQSKDHGSNRFSQYKKSAPVTYIQIIGEPKNLYSNKPKKAATAALNTLSSAMSKPSSSRHYAGVNLINH